ncbi:MAG: flagellin [Actinomycetota bacterium]|jgi:flagellar hook-associated protein 3 FlgL|nr:flagellin [Actinomycetota bacterium]
MRITTGFLVDQSVSRLQGRLASFEEAQNRLSSGRMFERSSENVNAMNAALGLRSERRSIDQAIRNAQDGATHVDLADTKLQQSLNALRRIRDLSIRASSSLNPTESNAIAEEMASLNDQLVSLANSTFLGKGLFAGTAAGEAVTLAAGTYSYTGDTGQLNRRISETESVKVNVTGDEVFGFTTAEDVFTMVARVENMTRIGDTAGVSNGIGDIDAAMDRIQEKLAELGATGNRIENTIERDLASSETIRRQLSQLEDVDLAESVLEIQTQEVALQATMGAVARALQPTLVDYLR